VLRSSGPRRVDIPRVDRPNRLLRDQTPDDWRLAWRLAEDLAFATIGRSELCPFCQHPMIGRVQQHLSEHVRSITSTQVAQIRILVKIGVPAVAAYREIVG